MLQSNRKLIGRSLVLIVLLLVVCGFVFYTPYRVLRQSTIDALNNHQLVLARQAAHGIQEFFHHYEKMLTYLAAHEDIVTLNEDGKKLLAELYSINKNYIRAVTRISKEGRIIHTVPYNGEVIGMDVSSQAHNAFIMQHHEQVVSDVFLAVQGYRTVAYAIPVFDDREYAGCLTILIPFDVFAEKYLSQIVIGRGGYAWMISKDGVELYCPVPGHIGSTIWETSSQFPTVIAMAEKMMRGEEGVATYTYDRIKNEQTEVVTKHAVYVPVALANNTWSIVVASPEELATSAISGFVRWWLTLYVLVVAGIVLYMAYHVRSRLITREEIRRKEAEEKLRRSEQFFAEVINNAHIPLAVVDGDGKVELVNKRAEELYGYSREDIPTVQEWFVKACPDAPLRTRLMERWQNEVARAMATSSGSEITALELPIRCKDGSTKDVFFDYTLIHDRLIVSLTDMTQHNKMQREKAQLLERENKAKKMEVIGLVAGSVAHDLNNILSGIVSYPDLLLAQLPEDSTLAPTLRRIRESGQRAATVVDDLLTAARGSVARKELWSVDGLVDEYLQSPEHEKLVSLHSGVSFIIRLGAPDAWIYCSPVHLKKSLMNLVANGAEAIESEGAVTIRTAPTTVVPSEDGVIDLVPGSYVTITVEDNGSGIAREDLSHIFEPFYSKKILGRSGSGLGLMIVQNCIEDHKGKIVVKSSAAGTSFTLYLPVASAQEGQRPEGERESLPRGVGERILVVDDEPFLRDIGARILRDAGYHADTVSSGEEAVEYIRSTRVDLVVLDMVMEPGINGRETFARVREINPQQKAILVSGYSESRDVRKTLAEGCGPLLKKPYTRVSLLRAVREELDRK